jgi:hypothetical protein
MRKRGSSRRQFLWTNNHSTHIRLLAVAVRHRRWWHENDGYRAFVGGRIVFLGIDPYENGPASSHDG